MRYRHHQFDVAHALTTHLLLGNLYTTTVAHNALITDALVFAAMTFVVLGRTKNALAKQATHLRLVSTVVDGFGLGYLTVRTIEDGLGRSETNPDFRKVAFDFKLFLK